MSIDDFKKIIKENSFFKNREIDDSDVLRIMSFLDEKKNCQECSGLNDCKNGSKGYEPFIDKNNATYYCECKYLVGDKKLQGKKDALNASYMPKQLQEATIEGFNVTSDGRRQCLKFVADFIQNIKNGYKKGAYIYGDVGVGKTYLLAALANELINRDIPTRLVFFPDLINEIKNNFDLLDEKLEMLKNVDVLIIDDFGVGNMTQWVRDSILAPVLNYRMLAEKPLFISSNVKFGKLMEYLTLPTEKTDIDAARLCRRINELCEKMSL